MKIMIFSLLLFSVLLNASAQLLLKAAMDRIGEFTFSWSNLIPIGIQVLTNPFIIAGLTVYVISVGVWIMVLSRVEVSIAYPMVSLGYIVTAIVSYYWLGENISFTRMLGIAVILFGVYLVTRS